MSKRKLLLADDSMTIQKVVNLTFADEGIEVFTVGNGSLAIEKLSEIEPDLVLADVHMPGLNGYEVCEQIRMNPRFQNVPVMLLVGSFEPFDEHEAQRVGANDFLTKPFQSIRQLIQKVTTLLDNPKSGIDEVNSAESAVGTEVSQEKLPRENAQEDFYVEEPTSLQNAPSPPNHDFSDVALDDEMIETSSVSNFENVFPALTTSSNQSGEQNSFDEHEMTLETSEPSQDEVVTDNEVHPMEAASLEMRHTEPISFDDIQDINSMMLAPAQSEKEAQNFEVMETNASDATTQPLADLDLAMTSAANDWQQSAPSERYDGEFEVELDLPSSQEQSYQHTEFELVDIENNYPVEAVSQSESFDFLPALELQKVETLSDDEPLELDLADAGIFRIDDEDSILDLDEEEAVEEMPMTFETAPMMQETAVRQNFSESANNAVAQVGSQAVANLNLGFPPEVIEAIAQLVVEKLSDKVIERIAWEIVPDRFDRIVRQQMDKHSS